MSARTRGMLGKALFWQILAPVYVGAGLCWRSCGACLTLLTGVLLVAPAVCAQVASDDGAYTDRKVVQAFIHQMHERYGFSKPLLQQWLSKAQRQDSVIQAISRPAEHTMSWARYRSIFLDTGRITKGQAFLDRYRETFDRAERVYGVSRYVITRYNHSPLYAMAVHQLAQALQSDHG